MENWRAELCPSDYDKGCEDGSQRALNPKPNEREDPSDAQSSVWMLPTSCLIGVCNMASFLSSLLFKPSLGLEVTVMADFLISQRTFVLIQQFLDRCVQSGGILVIVNTFSPFRLWLLILIYTLKCMVNNSMPFRAAVFPLDLSPVLGVHFPSLANIKWTGKALKPVYHTF